MSYTVTLKPGLSQVCLPNGKLYDGGAVATLTDTQYAKLSATAPAALFSASAFVPPKSVWRREDLPDPAQADAVYAGAAPTISTAQTTTPTAGYIKQAPVGVTLAGSDVTGKFTFMGAGAFQIGAGAPDTSYVLPTSKYPNTYTSGQTTWAVEFGTDAQIIQLRFKYISAATMYRLSINGQKLTDLMQLSGGTTVGSGHMITIDFGSAGPRHLRFDFTTMPFGGVYIPPTASLWSVASRLDRGMIFGDSLSDGSASNTGAGAGTWFHRAARLFGFTDAWDQARGGTGYLTPGSYAVLQDRLANDVLPYKPTKLFVWAGYNDNGGNQATLSTAASTLYASIKTNLPDCQTYVLGCWSPSGSPAASIVNTDNTLRAAALAASLPFISPVTGSIYDTLGNLVTTHGPFISGTGKAGATTGTGNADLYIGTDGIHPTDAGHIYLSRRIVAAVRELLPA